MADDERAAALRERIERLHRSSVEATDNGRPALAARRLRQALTRLGWPATAASTAASATDAAADDAGTSATTATAVTDDVVADHAPGRAGWDDLLARLLTSLAHAEAELGRTELGLSLLDEAQRGAPPPELAIVHAQRGLLLLRLGSNAEALRELDLAAPMLLDHDRVELARVLLNRSVIHLSTGRIRQARDDAQRSAQIAHALGHDVLAAKALHNDGYCDLLLGDVPAALAVFARVEPLYREASPGFLPVLALDRARALLAVGLTDEAGRTLDQAIDGFRRQRLMQDYAEAELARAQCALDAGRAAEARDWARRAESHFWRRGSTAWALRAALMRLRGDFAQATAPGPAPRGEPATETGRRPAGSITPGPAPRPGAAGATGSGAAPRG
ncbi:hypothetical protein, partial [Nonomuraea rosea]|uniref:hypothetical protein n=1 Tax=Nonomuraea rosea TaxID=638574 RepID=UPI0031EC0E70